MVPVWCCVSVPPAISAVAMVAQVVCALPLLSVPCQQVPLVPRPFAVAELPLTAKLMVPLGALAVTSQAISMSLSSIAVTSMMAVSVYVWSGTPAGDVIVATDDQLALNLPTNAAAGELVP